MRIPVAEIKEQVGLHKKVPVTVSVEPVDIGGQIFHFDRPFQGQAEIWNAGDRLLVKARMDGEAMVACSRCLTPSIIPMKVSFEEDFIEGQAPEAEIDDVEAGLEERTVSYYTGDEIDLSDPLREHVLLELPMKPLCGEQCKGLCPDCGANLNDREHVCRASAAEKPVDHRLAKLKELLPKSDS